MNRRRLGALAFTAFLSAATCALHAAPPAPLVEAAKKEGRLVIVGPPVQAHRATIMKFEEAYPGIKIEYLGLPPHLIEPRIVAERQAGRYLVDVRVGGSSWLNFSQYIGAGWYADLRPAVVDPDVLDDKKWISGFQSGFMDQDKKHIYAFTAEAAGGLYVNKDLVREEFTYARLLDSKFAGKIALLDPRHPGPGSTALQQIIANIGEDKACELLTKQKVVLSETPKQLVDWAARGNYPILVGADTATMNTYKDQGLAKNVVIVKDEKNTVLSKWGNVMLMDRAPNPDAAKLFVNWLLSREAQAEWSKSGSVNSRRTDVPPGNPVLAITPQVWAEGYNISAHRNASDSDRALKLAKQCLK